MPFEFEEAGAADERWLAFCRATPEVGLFQSPEWGKAVADAYGFEARVLLALRDGRIAGGLPFTDISDFRGARRVSSAFADNVESAPVALWPAFEEYVAGKSVPWNVRTRCEPSARAASGRLVAQHHAIQLPSTFEEMQTRFHLKHRQKYQQSCRTGMSYRRCGREALDVFYELHSGVRKFKHGLLPQPLSFFERLCDAFFPASGFILIAEHEGRPIAAMFFIAYGKTLYYKFSASALDALNLRPNNFLLTKGLDEAIKDGFECVDLGISDTEGLIGFKERIGGAASPVYAASYNPVEKAPAVAEVERTLGNLTKLLTEPDLPITAAQRGGDLLYRFFT